MIVVEPASGRYEMLESGGSNDEHLLERISALENRLGRLNDKVDRGLDLLLRQAQHSHFDRALVKALVGLLTDDRTIEADKLERLWIQRCQKDAEEQLESDHREELRSKILATYQGQQTSAFVQFVNEGFLYIDDNQPARGIRLLQRAAEMDRDNASLLYFVGEFFFKTGKTHQAQDYLARAYELSPSDRRISLLLGLTCADEGNIERAKELLNSATRLGGSTFAAHYGLGRLFVAEAKWPRALQQFKLALATKNSPEAHYTLGCLYYQLGRDTLAARHLRKALELDENYDEAFHVLGLVSQRAGATSLAAEYFKKAGTAGAAGKTKTPRSRKASSATPLTAPLFRVSPANSRRLITGGDRRLAEALRQDALNACSCATDGR
jgi:tetratricopeptide (TPR) repeat protein